MLVIMAHQAVYYAESKDEGETDVAGIPDFWLHVLQSHRGWSEEVSSLPL